LKPRKSKKEIVVRTVVLLFLVGGVAFFLVNRKEALVRQFTRLLENTLSSGTDYRVKIGRSHSDIFGYIRFEDVVIEEPWLPEGERQLFSAKNIQFHYRFLDFLSKQPLGPKIDVVVDHPEVHWRPRLRLRKLRFPWMEWMKQWAVSQPQHLAVRVQKLDLVFGSDKKKISGVDISYENNHFQAQIPVSHLLVAGSDVSSVVNVTGHFELGLQEASDRLTGEIRTEGTIINWNPLAQETQFSFEFSEDNFNLTSSNFLGGIEITGTIDFTRDYAIDFLITAENYPLVNLEPFLKVDQGLIPPGRFDLSAHFYGSSEQLNVEARTRIYEGWIGGKTFTAMDVNVVGIYPTLRLTDSKILMQDESSMRFADKTLEARDLFRGKTYEALIAEAQQETVVWGDWELSRSKDIKDNPEFLMQRNLSDNATVHFKKFYEDSSTQDRSNEKQMELGFEYRLRSKDSLKLELRDDEEFVGVERKMKF